MSLLLFIYRFGLAQSEDGQGDEPVADVAGVADAARAAARDLIAFATSS